jgi:ribonuclease HI
MSEFFTLEEVDALILADQNAKNQRRNKFGLEIPLIINLISYNIGGLAAAASQLQKLNCLAYLIKHHKPNIVLLQETHLQLNTEGIIRAKLPHYTWTFNHGTSKSCGVAIGIRGKEAKIKNVNKNPDGTFLGIKTKINNYKTDIYSVYFHPSGDRKKQGMNSFRSLIQTRTKVPAVIGGDFNLDKEDAMYKELAEACKNKGLAIVNNPYPSLIGKKRVIDQIIMSETILRAKTPYIYAYPSPTGDHNPLLLSTKNELKGKGHDPIPPHIAQHPAFIQKCMDKIPGNVFTKDPDNHPPECENPINDPITFLNIIEKAARDSFIEWKKEGLPYIMEKEEINKHWYAKKLVNILNNVKIIPSIRLKNPLHLEMYKKFEEKEENKEIPNRVWRRRNIKKYREEAKINFDETSKKIGVPINLSKQLATGIPNPYLTKSFKSNTLGILDPETNLPVRSPEQKRDLLGKYWKDIFGKIRNADRNITDELLDDYPRVGECNIKFNDELLEKIINKGNTTGSGPNGIPFSFHKEMNKKFGLLWPALIMASARSDFEPGEDFTEARLVLLPKRDGIIEPAETRPISITNSAYRIMTKYWAHHFGEVLSEVISENQKALLKGRYIDDCLDDIINYYEQGKFEGEAPLILQTDYQKAYDFINRDEILHMLKRINAPEALINVARMALAPSKTSIHINGTSPFIFNSVTGVKQGCPLSPLLYIMIFDLLVSKLPNEKDFFARAYMDDIALVFQTYAQLNQITPIFERYNKAVGSTLNFKKSLILYQKTPDEPPPPPWNLAKKLTQTKYLGIQIGKRYDQLNWEDRTPKIKMAANFVQGEVSRLCSPISHRMAFINVYILSHIPYIGRFSIIPESYIGKISTQIRRGLGGKNTIPNSALYSMIPPLNFSPAVIHPMLMNIACMAAKRPPKGKILETTQLSPNTIEWKRRWAINTFYRIIGLTNSYDLNPHNYFTSRTSYDTWKDTIKKPTHWIYKQIIARYPAHNPIKFTYDKGKQACPTLIHNTTHKIPKPLKHTFLLYMHKSWNHSSRTAKFIKNIDDKCRHGCGRRETHEHLLDCEKITEIMNHINNIFIVIKSRTPRYNHLKWPSQRNDLLLTNKLERKEQVIFNLIILATLKATIVDVGYNKEVDSLKAAELNFVKNFRSYKTTKPKTRATPNESNGQTAIDIFPPTMPRVAPAIGFFDGGGDILNLKGGAGAVIYRSNGEIAAKACTVALATSNGAEFTALYELKKMALAIGELDLLIFGDSKIAIDLANQTAICETISLIQINTMSGQLDHKFTQISYQLTPRKYNGRADRIAHAASISLERGLYYEKNPDDKSRPKGNKSRPTTRDIRETPLYQYHDINLSNKYLIYPIVPALKPTKTAYKNKIKKHYTLKLITDPWTKEIMKRSIFFQPHYLYEWRQERREDKERTMPTTNSSDQQTPHENPPHTPPMHTNADLQETPTIPSPIEPESNTPPSQATYTPLETHAPVSPRTATQTTPPSPISAPPNDLPPTMIGNPTKNTRAVVIDTNTNKITLRPNQILENMRPESPPRKGIRTSTERRTAKKNTPINQSTGVKRRRKRTLVERGGGGEAPGRDTMDESFTTHQTEATRNESFMTQQTEITKRRRISRRSEIDEIFDWSVSGTRKKSKKNDDRENQGNDDLLRSREETGKENREPP